MVSMRSILVAAVAVALLPACLAWGPISHYYFVCQSAYVTAPAWQGAPDLTGLLVGSDLPDALWNGWFLTGTQCDQRANRMHSPILAGYMIQTAVSNSNYYQDPYYLSLAYGYATHTIGDEVGFSPLGGYLGNLSTIIDWSLEWPFMLSVDAYLTQNPNTFPQQCPMPQSLPKQPLEQKGLDFLSYVESMYAVANPDLNWPQFNSTQLQECTDPWAPQVNTMNDLASTQLPDATIQQLIFFDRFGAKDAGDVVSNLQASWQCIQATYLYYFSRILDLSVTPEATWSDTQLYINNLFYQKQCTGQPVSAKKSEEKILHE